MADVLVVGSKIKAYIKEKGLHTSSDFAEGLSSEVVRLLDKAIERCKANKRSTVRPTDV